VLGENPRQICGGLRDRALMSQCQAVSADGPGVKPPHTCYYIQYCPLASSAFLAGGIAIYARSIARLSLDNLWGSKYSVSAQNGTS
jgi:hypothetical protein